MATPGALWTESTLFVWACYSKYLDFTQHFIHQVMYYTCGPINKASLTLLHSERPKLHTVLAFLSATGLTKVVVSQDMFCLLQHTNSSMLIFY